MKSKIMKILKDNYIYSTMVDKILELIKEYYIPIEYYKQQLDKLSTIDDNSCEICEIAYKDMSNPCKELQIEKSWKEPNNVCMTEKELVEKTCNDVEHFIQMQIDNLTPILKSRGWTPPKERGKQNKEWFEKGKNSVLRKNQSGCCCIINDNNEIVSLCAAHLEHLEEYMRAKGWTPTHGYDTSYGVCEVCDQLNSDKMRTHGWFHKDDPIDDVITVR